MKDKAAEVKYEVKPSPVELHKGEVAVAITGKFPPKYFNKKAVMTLTPVLKYANGETAFVPTMIQGEGVEGNNKAIKYAEGGSFSYNDKIAYSADMMRSELVLRASIQVKKKVLELGEVKIADGVVTTPNLLAKTPKAIYVPDQFQRIILSTKEAEILYLINKADVRPAELKKDEIKAINDYIKSVKADPRKELKGLEISAYASPDGELDLNSKLAESRQKSATSYLEKEMKKNKVEKGTAEDFLSVVVTPEDWDGFKKLMEVSDIQDKDLILRVLSMYSDPIVREREIKNISKTYNEIADKILPALRRSKLIVKTNNIGYSDEEFISIINTNVDSLKTVEEYLYAAKLAQDNNKKVEVYKAAAVKFPADFRCNNNLGFTYIAMNQVADARAAFEAAKTIIDNDIVKNNLGACSLLEGDVVKAEEMFTAALGAGADVSYNLGIINVINANYTEAVNYFGASNEYNGALAKLLAGQLDAAKATIDGCNEDVAMVYYLKAVIGARQANLEYAWQNLRTAIGRDASLKEYAKKDVEFLKFFNDDTFKSIVQ